MNNTSKLMCYVSAFIADAAGQSEHWKQFERHRRHQRDRHAEPGGSCLNMCLYFKRSSVKGG